MKIKVFFIVCIGAAVMLSVSSILVYTQLHAVKSVNMAPLADSLYKQDSKVLTWILSTIPFEKIETMKLPESWAEISVVNNGDLKLATSTNPAHKGIALYSHPQLLDQGSGIVNAIKSRNPSIVSVKDYMVVIQPLNADQSLIALKPKSWEKGLISEYESRLEETTSGFYTMLGIFLIIGVCITVFIAFIITRIVAAPTDNALDAFEALSLGDFDHGIKDVKGKEMEAFTESYLRLKTSLEMALERISRR
jgi:HAMP domain-containing protein